MDTRSPRFVFDDGLLNMEDLIVVETKEQQHSPIHPTKNSLLTPGNQSFDID